MKEKKKFGLKSQNYVAPRAMAIAVACDSSLLSASVGAVSTSEYEVINDIVWP